MIKSLITIGYTKTIKVKLLCKCKSDTNSWQNNSNKGLWSWIILFNIYRAGCYILKERDTYGRNYSYHQYMRDLERTRRDFAEQQTKQVCNYPWTLTTALMMCVLQQKPLYKVWRILDTDISSSICHLQWLYVFSWFSAPSFCVFRYFASLVAVTTLQCQWGWYLEYWENRWTWWQQLFRKQGTRCSSTFLTGRMMTIK